MLLSGWHRDSASLAAVLLSARMGALVLDHAIFSDLELQPATGLVDLNTASPKLLRRFLEGYDLSAAEINIALDHYREWRSEGRKLLRVSDFIRVTQLSANQLPNLQDWTTISSGRTGLAKEQAPAELLRHLLGGVNDSESEPELAEEIFLPFGFATNQHIRRQNGSMAVLHFGDSKLSSRILSLH